VKRGKSVLFYPTTLVARKVSQKKTIYRKKRTGNGKEKPWAVHPTQFDKEKRNTGEK